jgi:hypothetical protein
MTRVPILTLLCSALLTAQAPADREVLAKIRTEGLEHSRVAPVFEYLTIELGPRLTASPAHKRAAEWTRDRLASYGLQNAHLEAWHFGRGWSLEKLTVEMIEPRYLPLIGYADGWSASTSGELVASPVLIGGRSPEDVAAMRAEIKGAIVMTQPIMTSFVRKDRPQPSDAGYKPNSAAYATSVGRVVALFERAIVDLRAAGAEIVDDFTVPGFETFPRPPQTPARTKADWEAFFAYEGPRFPVKTVAELRDAPPAKRVHPLHIARVAEIAAVTLPPEQDPQTIQGRKDEQMYRDKLGAAMETARVVALVFPVWTFPPKINGDRGQTPQGSLTFIGSAMQWPVIVVPFGFCGRQSPDRRSDPWPAVE